MGKCNATITYAPGVIGSIEATYQCERDAHNGSHHQVGLLEWDDGDRTICRDLGNTPRPDGTGGPCDERCQFCHGRCWEHEAQPHMETT